MRTQVSSIFLLSLLLNAFAVKAAELDEFIDVQLKHGASQGHYQLPKQNLIIESIIKEAQADATNGPSRLDPVLQRDLDNLGYALEIKTFGECSSGHTGEPCVAYVISRRDLSIFKGNLRQVTDIYTSDLRFPKDKTLSIHGVQIERHHWEFDGSGATEIISDTLPDPMQTGREYKIKKCRDGFMVSWKCNTISYELLEIDSSSLVLLGRQVTTDGEPDTFTRQGCSGDKDDCEKKFLDQQRLNTAAGTLSLTVFKKMDEPIGQEAIKVFEINVGDIEDPAEVRHLLIAEENMKEGLQTEFERLYAKMRVKFSSRPEKEVAVIKMPDKKLQSERMGGFLTGCILAVFATYLSVRHSMNFKAFKKQLTRRSIPFKVFQRFPLRPTVNYIV